MGGHLIRHLAEEETYERIINADLREAPEELAEDVPELVSVKWDVREEADPSLFRRLGCGPRTHIYNLAAICRIPGHDDEEYFRTNIRGAETVCALAEALDCRTVVFTSSIAPYGSSEERKTEESMPVPDNPYGSSKLAAEYIHRGWQRAAPGGRNLSILRPGIIFGPREQANFTRLYRSLKKGWFVYPGRRDTRKACVYVKDVARACRWFAENRAGLQLYNLVYERAPTIEEICEALHRRTDAGKARFTAPAPLLIAAARCIRAAGSLTGSPFTGIHPDRVRKVMISTDVSGEKLAASGFRLEYSLEEGLSDWYERCGGTLR